MALPKMIMPPEDGQNGGVEMATGTVLIIDEAHHHIGQEFCWD